MLTFIEEIADKVLDKRNNLRRTKVVLPSRRAGLLLKNKLVERLGHTASFLPAILSIEDLISDLSGLQAAPQTVLQFDLYSIYKDLKLKDEESFITFLSWSQNLLSDFNEIDRYLIPTASFFDYLSAIKDLEHWSIASSEEPLIKGYLAFWKSISTYYTAFIQLLLEKGMGYQGLLYRKAAEKVEEYAKTTDYHYLFAGFNALNTAEQQIIQSLLKEGRASILWDIDSYFLDQKNNAVSLFINDYKKRWAHYRINPLEKSQNHYTAQKQINIAAIPQSIGQAKYVGQLLSAIDPVDYQDTAVVLGDESLLLPLLNSLPERVRSLNITMGLPLDQVPDAAFFQAWFTMQMNKKEEGYYYKDILQLLSFNNTRILLGSAVDTISRALEKENLIYMNWEQLTAHATQATHARLLFDPWRDKAAEAIKAILAAIMQIKNALMPDKNWLLLEYLFAFQELFKQLELLCATYGYVQDIRTLLHFYKELIASETLDFRGDPYSGLQIMGVLESRLLDFKNVIITGLNEGTLPSGKNQNSYIPFDLKLEYKLPTFREKDAVYAYHFFRLIQRAKNINLIYNNQTSGVQSGEKSRFLLQLETEGHPNHIIKEIALGAPTIVQPTVLKQMPKNEAIIEKLHAQAAHGFSPSALTTYIRNPMDFYYRYVLGIKELDTVEDVIAHNTLGNVVHESLETLYLPTVGHFLTKSHLDTMIADAPKEIDKQFANYYNVGNIKKGKNLIIYHVALRFVTNLLNLEIKEIAEGKQIKVIACEKKLEVSLRTGDHPVVLRGTVDRLDELDGCNRIIDYKTGKVEARELKIADWELLTTDYKKHGKAFQVLCYALMLKKSEGLPRNLEAGILSFKNLNAGFMAFQEAGSSTINDGVLDTFESHLHVLISEILDIDKPFVEKEV